MCPDLFADCQTPLLLDGSMGSILQEMMPDKLGVLATIDTAWTTGLMLQRPELITGLHAGYIAAGADIVTTNTFRTNPYALQQSTLEADCRRAVQIAMQCARAALPAGRRVFIAGSNAPAEDCYLRTRSLSLQQLDRNHRQHTDALMEQGCDFILNETFGHRDEIELVCRYCSLCSYPFAVSLFLDENGKLLSGESLLEIISVVRNYSPLFIALNCISADTFRAALPILSKEQRWGFYLNCGSGNLTDHSISCGLSPTDYGELVREWLPENPFIIGSCCGSNPEHTLQLRRIINEKNYH